MNNWENNKEFIPDQETQIKNKLDELSFRIGEKYNNWDYSYKVEWDETNPNEPKIKEYKAVIMWVEFPWVDTPEEMIQILKFIQKLMPKLIEVYKNNWSNDKFYSWKWIWNSLDKISSVWDRSDLYIDNRFWWTTLDTVVLTNEGVEKILKWKDVNFYNNFIKSLAKAVNKYNSKIKEKNKEKIR